MCLNFLISSLFFLFDIFFVDSLIDLSEAQCSKTNRKWVSFYSLNAFAISRAFDCHPLSPGIPSYFSSYARGKCRGAGQNFWFLWLQKVLSCFCFFFNRTKIFFFLSAFNKVFYINSLTLLDLWSSFILLIILTVLSYLFSSLVAYNLQEQSLL